MARLTRLINLDGRGARGQSEIEEIDPTCLKKARETPKSGFCLAGTRFRFKNDKPFVESVLGGLSYSGRGPS